MKWSTLAAAALAAVAFFSPVTQAQVTLTNVSYDPTRELYVEYNKLFAEHWKKTHNEDVTVKASHGGSGKQARSIIDGLEADVATLALAADIDVLAEKAKLLPADWQKRLPDNSAPYTSTIVFLVRKGNPKAIKDWDDLAKPGIGVVTPNPKTSGGARWNYLAAWGYALKKNGGDQAKAQEFVGQIFNNVSVLDTGARASTITFTQRNVGDVLLAWENEAYLSLKEQGGDQFEIVTPSVSILAEPTVAVIDKNVDKHNTRAAAEEYLKFLYSPEAQVVIAKNFYRPRDAKALEAATTKFAKLDLFTIDDTFGGWTKAQKEHFADGGTFDEIQAAKQ